MDKQLSFINPDVNSIFCLSVSDYLAQSPLVSKVKRTTVNGRGGVEHLTEERQRLKKKRREAFTLFRQCKNSQLHRVMETEKIERNNSGEEMLPWCRRWRKP